MFRQWTERHSFRHLLNGVTTLQPYKVTCRETLTNNRIIFSSAKLLLMPDSVTGWWLILDHLWFRTGLLPSKYNWWWWFVGRYNLGCCKSNKYNNSSVTFIYSTLSEVLEFAECDVSFPRFQLTMPREKPNQWPPVHLPKGDSISWANISDIFLIEWIRGKRLVIIGWFYSFGLSCCANIKYC